MSLEQELSAPAKRELVGMIASFLVEARVKELPALVTEFETYHRKRRLAKRRTRRLHVSDMLDTLADDRRRLDSAAMSANDIYWMMRDAQDRVGRALRRFR